MRTRIKICGFKTSQTIDAAIDAGADALGFNLFPASVRAIDLQTFALLTKRVPAFVSIVALFVNPTAEEVRTALAAARIDLLQFHGDEPPEFCEQFGKPFMKAFAVDESFDLLKSRQTYSNAAALLLDTPSAGHGGSGKTFNWQLINTTSDTEAAPRASLRDANAPRLVLSGGLTAANVADAINAVHPFAVDVSSGVESSRGVKDSKLIYEFCAAVPK
jgi:phosphoribosylanthranilate isomerase